LSLSASGGLVSARLVVVDSQGQGHPFRFLRQPNWCEYMTSRVLPLVRARAVVLNWSERRKWSRWSLKVSVFYAFGGSREFNPMIVKFELFRKAKVLRYWSAFQDWKRGYTETVESLNSQLSSML
jgi:hypothetical protein